MSEERLALGRWGEEAACRFLERSGHRIVARNLRTPVGEIDIIARRGSVLLIVEVKTRRSNAFGTPAEAVGPVKQRQILRAARWYFADRPPGRLQPRFDVIAVMPGPDGAPRCEHIEDAFGA